MIEAGCSLFRLNFSHGDFDAHKRRLELVRRLSYQLNIPLTVLGDLPGPKLRVGKVPEGGIMLTQGQEVLIRTDIEESRDGDVPLLVSDYEKIVDEVHPGHRVLINDGAVRMLATASGPEGLRCSVMTGGLVTTRKGINLPDSELSVPAVTERDWEIVDWAVKNHVDYLALSFVRKADEVLTLKRGLRQRCEGDKCGSELSAALTDSSIPVIAKMETPQAVDRMDAIIEAADGIMVARGDLGVEMDVADVPDVQKRLVRACHSVGKPCIVATQMLESMIENANPTRAEVSDVANAIYDGADCVMLSGETAVGKHPILAVETMTRVALATEAALRREETPEPTVPQALRKKRELIPALAHGAWHMANDVGAQLIIIWSQQGGGARYLSRHNFQVPVLAFSSNGPAVRRMNLLFGVFPVLWIDVPSHRSEFAELVDRLIVDMGWVERGAPVVLLGGKPLDKPGSINTVALRYAGEMIDRAGATKVTESAPTPVKAGA
ncbi:MAG: pyruvate kinase [Phycisphaerales bacterium]